MAWKDPRDPRDPWAWRNTWTGEARTDYAELWIFVPLIILLSLCAIGLLIPIFVHMYCRSACPCPFFWHRFDRFLQVLHELGQKTERNDPSSFVNPAFDPELCRGDKQNSRPSGSSKLNRTLNNNQKLSQLRHSVRISRPNQRKQISRSKSCPGRPVIPRIKL